MEQSNNPSGKTPLDSDDLLCELHEQYIRQVNDSGVPLWMLDQYYQVQLQGEEVESRQSDQPENNPDVPQD